MVSYAGCMLETSGTTTLEDMATILRNLDAALNGDDVAEASANDAAERIYVRHPEAQARLFMPQETV